MKNFHINWNGEANQQSDIDKFETPVGTHFRFFTNGVGDLIMRRVIPITYIAAY